MILILIDREKIKKAKEKLGDNNAFHIAKLLDVPDFDERNFRACCPFHTEDTPSWIYNPKNYTFHCFGCGRNTDIIDALIHTGKTYVTAVRTLFDMVDIKYSFGEHEVRDELNYRYPREEPLGDKAKALEYLALRKISSASADHVDIRQDANGNIVFNYYDTNDTLKMVKYRPSRKVKKGENKMWCQKGADTTPLLFNMNRVNTTEPLIITEGESDLLALVEAGCTNAVSVPFGCNNHTWIETNWDWLEQFESIIICGDNDEPGRKMIRDITPRLGSWRVKVADLPSEFVDNSGRSMPIKDANDVLYLLGKEALCTAILNARDAPVPSVVDFADIPDVDLNEVDGIQVGIHELDKSLLRLFYGTFNIVSGTPGAGKTSLLYQVICNAMDSGVNCWVFSRELNTWLSRNWQMHILAGNRNVVGHEDPSSNAKYYVVPKEIKQKISEYYRGRLSFYRDDYPNDQKSLMQAMVDTRRKYGARVFLIDNLMTVDLGGNDENKNERQTAFVNELIDFSVKYDACVILVAHPRKMQDAKADVDMYDVSGSSNIINLAHRAIGLRRVYKAEREGILRERGDGYRVPPNPFSVMISVFKDRLRGMSGLKVGVHYDVPTRRFFSNPDEYNKQYSWDKTKYPEPLPYPIIDQTEEVFGTTDE